MNEEQRDEICDLLPKDMIIWDWEDELESFKSWTYSKWRKELGHPLKHSGCCATCGCATSCMLSVFYDALIGSTIRELDKQGFLKEPDDQEEKTDDAQPG